ncbi:hypothetical protein PRUPE_8G118200 [Prunus persica]|uniref:Uncharacterized protein n=1 Tax=Prunus persica TaxID=3760 RepID=A0A251MWL9_PRUPE|nr:hypothetical protein PRUPE_8G118200 [Prunus persica]
MNKINKYILISLLQPSQPRIPSHPDKPRIPSVFTCSDLIATKWLKQALKSSPPKPLFSSVSRLRWTTLGGTGVMRTCHTTSLPQHRLPLPHLRLPLRP